MPVLLTTLIALATTSGKLFMVGGGTTPEGIPGRFISECGGPKSLIIVLPLAAEKPEESRSSYDWLKEHGAKNLYFFGHSQPNQKDLDELKSKLSEVRGIWMGGGVQERIVQRLGKAWIDENIKPLLARGVNFYGTSAGAMACSDPMITGPGKEPDTAEVGTGIGLTTWVIDTHFRQRKRQGRLKDALRQTGVDHGVGLSESEWIVIQDDKIVEEHGTPDYIDTRKPAG